MTHALFDRSKLKVLPLAARENQLSAEKVMIRPEQALARKGKLGAVGVSISRAAERIARARKAGAPVVLAFGAHAIKNGLGPVMAALAEEGWVTHFATNGAGSIHDWEFAFLGATGEDVRANVATGSFGLWDETGRLISLAVALGALEAQGYGESVGALVETERLVVPRKPAGDAAVVAELAEVASAARLKPGTHRVPHRWKAFSLQAACFRLGIPFTVHPGIGYDIIYTHPAASGAVFGRAGYRDFLEFAESVRNLSGGVYLSVGSAVMSPMIFEKALSMAQNVALAKGKPVAGHSIYVVDIAPPPSASTHDWRAGEPPPEDPGYYLRYCKTFSRMGGEMEYLPLDNRDFIAGLYRELHGRAL